jgi:hypothetical protein
MNVKQALTQLATIATDSAEHEQTQLMIDCPQCGRQGELGSIRTRVVVGQRLASEAEKEQASHDAELRRIADELGVPAPASIEDLLLAIRGLRRDLQGAS